MDVIWPKPGKYVVAVSGGVDSVALLDMLAQKGEYELIVAHADHGIRDDSAADAVFVAKLALNYGYNIVITKLHLPKDSSEANMRHARYDFLFKVMQDHGATGIITAHHLDDVLETSIMNVRRGTDRYGAAGGMNREGIIRPLSDVTKQKILEYAQQHNLEWHEDSTNSDTTYTRNDIRQNVLPEIDRETYEEHLHRVGELNDQIDVLLNGRTSITGGIIQVSRTCRNDMGLRELEVLIAYALRQAKPGIELSSRRVAQVAREIMLGTDKISFSTGDADGIIIDIQ